MSATSQRPITELTEQILQHGTYLRDWSPRTVTAYSFPRLSSAYHQRESQRGRYRHARTRTVGWPHHGRGDCDHIAMVRIAWRTASYSDGGLSYRSVCDQRLSRP